MYQIIEIVKRHEWIKKPDYTTQTRQLIDSFQPIKNTPCQIQNQQLFIHDYLRPEKAVPATGIIFILHEQKILSDGQSADIQIHPHGPKGFLYDIFRWKTEDESIRIDVHPTEQFTPAIDAHTIGVLKEGKCIQYLINSKWDGRFQQRSYYEANYLIRHAGTISAIQWVSAMNNQTAESIPIADKIINERKILY